MASVLKVFLNFLCKLLCKLRFTGGFIPHCFKSCAPFLAFLGRRLGIWRLWNNGKGTFQRAECSFPGTGAVRQDHAVACSNIPESARHPSATAAAVQQAQLASHSSLNPTGVHGHRRGQSSTSVVVGIENPSTESLPRSHLVDSPPPPEELYWFSHCPSIPASNPPDLPEELPQLTPTDSSSIPNLDLPGGRFLQLIVSEQVPRYTKGVTVQVNIIITPSNELNSHQCLIDPSPPSVPKQIGPEQSSPEVDCAPWIPATHPNGALYFFDRDRVRALAPL